MSSPCCALHGGPHSHPAYLFLRPGSELEGTFFYSLPPEVVFSCVGKRRPGTGLKQWFSGDFVVQTLLSAGFAQQPAALGRPWGSERVLGCGGPVSRQKLPLTMDGTHLGKTGSVLQSSLTLSINGSKKYYLTLPGPVASEKPCVKRP